MVRWQMDAVMMRKRGRPRKMLDGQPVRSPREQAALAILRLHETCEGETIKTKGGRKLVRFTPRVQPGHLSLRAEQEA